MNPNSANVIQQFIDFFVAWDRLMFVKVNGIWTNPIADKFFPFITDLHKSPIGIAVIALLAFIWTVKDRRHGWRFLVAIAISVAASDVIAYRLVKPIVQRQRPEFTQGLPVTLRVASTHSLSFPSNHATNMFAAATIVAYTIPGYGGIAFIIAALIAYSRVYVGVHFPFDVIGGALFGFIIARIIWNFMRHWCEYVPPEEPSKRLKHYGRSSKNPTGE